MYLKSLEVQGFKSFPDKTLIRFGDDITAIVGPNGSGKSNISDAILWVMGEQSTKTLRGAKMEDVIFGGTQKRAAVGFAEATLTLDNTDRALPYDSDEVMITRRYYRSGDSEYYINRQSSRLRDIHELFMDTGIGRDGYSIIGQGTIDQILLGKSEERRSMLEEVAGISKFRYRKNEAERKLNATEENLVRLGDIVGELEERLPGLERQAEKARKYLAMYEEKKDLEIALWLEELDQIKENAKKIDEQYSIAKGQLEGLTVEVDNIEQEINLLYEENSRITTEIDRIRQSQTAWEEQLGVISSQKAVLESQAEFEQGVIDRLEQELVAVGSRKEESEEKILQLTAEIENKTADITTIDEKINAIIEEIKEITAKSEDQQRQTGALQVRLQENSAERNRLQMEMISAHSTVESHQKRIADLAEAKFAQVEQLNGVEEELASLRNTQKEKEEEKESEQNASNGLRKMLEIKERTYNEALEKEQKCAQERNALEQRSRILSEMEKHLEGFGGAVKLVLEQSRRGILHGIVGTVSQLIKVEEEYLIAVETALGAGIQNIVTTDNTSAKNAMLWLKRQKGGRATFLPLNTITPKPIKEDFSKAEGFIGIADELVQTDASNRKAIEFLLGRTLVCETIDDAMKLARSIQNRYKIVTLDGQVINAGGSMTGGSAAKSGGLLSRGIELERIEKELVVKNGEYEELAKKLDAASRDKNTLDARLNGAEDAIHLLEEELTRIEGLLESKEVVAASYRELINGYDRESETVQGAIKTAEEHGKALWEQIDALEKKASELQEELTSLQGLSSDDQARMEELKQRSSGYEMDKMGLFKEIEGIRSLIGQMQTQLALIGKETEEKNEQILASRARIESSITSAKEMDLQAQDLRRRQSEGEERTKALAEQRQDQERRQTNYRLEQKEKNSAKEKLIEEVSRLDNKLSGISEQSDRIIAQLLDMYELTVTEAKETVKPLEDRAEAKKRVHALKGSIKALGSVNVESIEEYATVKERYDFMNGQVQDLIKSIAELEKIIRELLSQMRDIFSEKFYQLNEEFQKIFSELFGGGTAKLILSDPEDVLNCDIDVKAAPPGKIIKNLVSMSGGERAFTAICLYFAILKIRPTPFCVVDEIEAALDDVNVTRFASYLRHYCATTQFVCITHRRGTMEEADVLYGVTMPEQGISKLLTINVNEIAEQLKI
ncbi:MAG: chromosome segregation protein SMC [Clostridia bacterium]|nr:chromosome segregation protein SMC [Clostridia bacterium]